MALIKELLALSEGVEGSPAEKAAHDFLMKKYGDYAAPLKPLERSGVVYFQVKVPTGKDGDAKVWNKSEVVFLKVKGSQVSTIAKNDFKELTESLLENEHEEEDDYEEDRSFDEVVDEFLDKKGIHQFEGPRGLRNLDILAKGLGYRGGSSEFFEDNSGALEAVIEWIKQFGDRVPEWKESLESVLGESLSEAKNHMGETEYSSFASWKAAVKKKHPDFWIDGDKDIAQAMVGEQPFKRGKTKSVGEWDGSVGTVF